MEHDQRHHYEDLTEDSVLVPKEERVMRITENFSTVVIVTNQYAYKIKKPIKDGLVDYSTFERRLDCAKGEMAKGRIFSGDLLYITILPVATLSGGKVAIGGEMRPDNIAIKMVRFDETSALLNRVKNERLPGGWEVVVVDYLLSVHERTETGKRMMSSFTTL